jgi:hypothetical protein
MDKGVNNTTLFAHVVNDVDCIGDNINVGKEPEHKRMQQAPPGDVVV